MEEGNITHLAWRNKPGSWYDWIAIIGSFRARLNSLYYPYEKDLKRHKTKCFSPALQQIYCCPSSWTFTLLPAYEAVGWHLMCYKQQFMVEISCCQFLLSLCYFSPDVSLIVKFSHENRCSGQFCYELQTGAMIHWSVLIKDAPTGQEAALTRWNFDEVGKTTLCFIGTER